MSPKKTSRAKQAAPRKAAVNASDNKEPESLELDAGQLDKAVGGRKAGSDPIPIIG